MKKLIMMVLAMILVVCCSASLAETTIEGSLKTDIALKSVYEENPVVEGEDPVTGLPASGEPYTPIMMILDNAENAYPHWGVMDASMFFQIPNAGKAATKLMALFTDKYPEIAGGVRSARMTMLPVAYSFDAAFAYGGKAPVDGSMINVDSYLRKWSYNKRGIAFNMLGNHYRQREDFEEEPHNLSSKIQEIHQKLVADNVEFKVRPYKFTDAPRTEGETANLITIKMYTDKKSGQYNNASYAEYAYREGDGYIRNSAAGEYRDRFVEGSIPFANVIVMRADIRSQDGYVFYRDHLCGEGPAEIFQNGKYVQGAWVRRNVDDRIVFVDVNGEELELQRGRSFVIITDDSADVIYE